MTPLIMAPSDANLSDATGELFSFFDGCISETTNQKPLVRNMCYGASCKSDYRKCYTQL